MARATPHLGFWVVFCLCLGSDSSVCFLVSGGGGGWVCVLFCLFEVGFLDFFFGGGGGGLGVGGRVGGGGWGGGGQAKGYPKL